MKRALAALLLAIGCTRPAGAPATWQPQILGASSQLALPDFSYAGYHWDEAPPPRLAPTLDARTFGALPDDGQDDTEALRRALATAHRQPGSVVLRLPKGRYEISDILFIERSRLVLQGEGSGPGGTLIAVNRPLEAMPRPALIEDLSRYLEANDKRVGGRLFSPFSWTGGVFWIRAPEGSEPRVAGARSGRRGQHELELDAPTALVAGDRIRIRWRNPFGASSPVLEHVFGLRGPIAGERLADPEQAIVVQDVSVLALDGSTLRIKERLLHDLRPGWNADVQRSARLQEVGIEHVALEFPDVPYGGHHQEAGYNGIYVTGLSHGWVRDVTVRHADSALLSDDSDHVSLEGIALSGRSGHYGLHFGSVHGFLARDFAIEADFQHSLSFNTRCTASVFTSGVVESARLDQHRGANHQNLFDALRVRPAGERGTLFEHGGASYWGPTAGALNVFWNLEVSISARGGKRVLGGVEDAGPARIIGLHGNTELELDYPGAYVEGLNRPHIAVPSLHAHQLARRVGR
jgi:hypothetical protein